MKRAFAIVLALLAAAAPGCQAAKIPAQALALQPESLQTKQVQTRVYETEDEKKILAAAAALLQDLGYNLDESHVPLGLLTASKERSAVESGQVAAAVTVAILFGANMPVDKNQKIRATVVSRPIGEEKKSVTVRLTLQRVVWNTHNQVSKAETVNDEIIYQEFFDKLSQSIFLEAHQI